jgi:hypothetical protein
VSREANRMSREEAARLDAYGKMDWRTWERKIDMALKVNGWTVWRDRVMPKRFGKDAQKVGRKAGLPDRLVGKVFENHDDIPKALMAYPPKTITGPVSVVGFIEAKTGRATATPEQERWLEFGRLCPGMFSLVVYPQDWSYLIKCLGGKEPL